MGEKRIQLRILTPGRPVLEEELDMVILRTREGDMGVLHGHLPCAVQLDYGLVRGFRGKEETHTLAVMGGFARVDGRQVTVLTPTAAEPNRIQEVLDRLERDRQENIQREKRYEAEINRAQSALRRTLVQMDIGAHSVMDREAMPDMPEEDEDE